MRVLLGLLIISMPAAVFAAEEAPTFDAPAAERFAKLALACVAKE